MTITPSAESVILAHLPLLSEVVEIVTEDMQVVLHRNIERELETFMEDSGWKGEPQFDDGWVAPTSWCELVDDEDTPKVDFTIGSIQPTSDYLYSWLELFCGTTKDGLAGLLVAIDDAYVNPKEWKRQLALPLDKQLADLGFEIRSEGNKNYLILPVTLIHTELSEAWDSGDLSRPLRRFADALRKLPDAVKPIESMLAACWK